MTDQSNIQTNHTRGQAVHKEQNDSAVPSEHDPATGVKLKNREEHEVDIFGSKQQETQKYPRLASLLDSLPLNILVSLFTIYALFGDDFRIIATSKSADPAFDTLLIMCLIIFSVEIILSVLVKKDYFNSFFFWLDAISTVTLIMDLTWVSNAIEQAGQGGSAVGSTAGIARASRASRIGTRAGRIIRIIRLIRLVKIFKLVQDKRKKKIEAEKLQEQNPDQLSKEIKDQKETLEQMEHGKQSKAIQGKLNRLMERKKQLEMQKIYQNKEEDNDLEEEKESRVGKKLAEIITIRVIILVLCLILILPLFSASYYFELDTDMDQHLSTFTSAGQDTNNDKNTLETLFNQVKTIHNSREDGNKSPLIYLYYENPQQTFTYESSTKKDDLRVSEQQITKAEYQVSGTTYKVESIVDVRSDKTDEAVLGILRTIFVSIVLTLGSLYFSKDINDLALRPIERMIRKVNQIASNPLSSKEQEIQETTGKDTNETLLIENAITKIGVLLALGFGEAGSEIIAKNMAQQGDLNPMLPGRKQCAIFGFCDIRGFNDVNEVLQEEIMVFVNTVASVVHKIVDRFQGSANKNIGEAFLLVWKIPDQNVQLLDDGTYSISKNRQVKNICELSLVSFLKVIAALQKKSCILKYREHEGLNERMPNFKIKMGFGLHVGWAIEGAIGSIYKIDASYLSPNVNMAARLEAATRQYGVPLLMTNKLVENFSKKAQKICREIDRVTVKGSVEPIGLFTVDMNMKNIKPQLKNKLSLSSEQEKRMKQMLSKELFSELSREQPLEKTNLLFFEHDQDLPLLLEDSQSEFREVFEEGFKQYIGGNWEQAKKFFETCLTMKPNEEPSKVLLNVMGKHMYSAPANWKGYRELTSK